MHVTKTLIKKYLDLRERRLSLGRQASDLQKQEAEIGNELAAYVRARGGKALTVLRSGFVLAIKTVKGSVGWREEFVRVAGQEEAEKLVLAAPSRESLSVEYAE